MQLYPTHLKHTSSHHQVHHARLRPVRRIDTPCLAPRVQVVHVYWLIDVAGFQWRACSVMEVAVSGLARCSPWQQGPRLVARSPEEAGEVERMRQNPSSDALHDSTVSHMGSLSCVCLLGLPPGQAGGRETRPQRSRWSRIWA